MFRVGDILILKTAPKAGWYGENRQHELKVGDKVTISSYGDLFDGSGFRYGFKDIKEGKTLWISKFVEREFELDIKTIRKKKLNRICLKSEIY